jgi:hypothetical protein
MKEIILTIILMVVINTSLITIIPIIAPLDQTPELSKAGNVTSTIKPQGTSLGEHNKSSISEDSSETTSAGNVTSTIKPQGTSLGEHNKSSISEDSSQTTSAGNVTSTIKPQGTSIHTPN